MVSRKAVTASTAAALTATARATRRGTWRPTSSQMTAPSPRPSPTSSTTRAAIRTGRAAANSARDRARRAALPATQTDRRADVRSHQAQPRVRSLPPSRPNRRAHRVAINDADPQPHQAPHPPNSSHNGLKTPSGPPPPPSSHTPTPLADAPAADAPGPNILYATASRASDTRSAGGQPRSRGRLARPTVALAPRSGRRSTVRSCDGPRRSISRWNPAAVSGSWLLPRTQRTHARQSISGPTTNNAVVS